MTIEEAIEHYEKDAQYYDDKYLVEECNQIADWLEELKFLRTAKETMYIKIYNQALEDFIKKAKQEQNDIDTSDYDEFYIGIRVGYRYSIEIARRLKK